MTDTEPQDPGAIEVEPVWPDDLVVNAMVVNHFAILTSPDQGFYLVGGHYTTPLMTGPGDFEKWIARSGGAIDVHVQGAWHVSRRLLEAMRDQITGHLERFPDAR